MIPHNGGDTQRDNGFIKPHTRRIPRNIPKGAKRTMSAYTPCALRFYTLVLRLTAVTLTHVSGETRHSHEEEREESALAQVLFNTQLLHHTRQDILKKSARHNMELRPFDSALIGRSCPLGLARAHLLVPSPDARRVFESSLTHNKQLLLRREQQNSDVSNITACALHVVSPLTHEKSICFVMTIGRISLTCGGCDPFHLRTYASAVAFFASTCAPSIRNVTSSEFTLGKMCPLL